MWKRKRESAMVCKANTPSFFQYFPLDCSFYIIRCVFVCVVLSQRVFDMFWLTVYNPLYSNSTRDEVLYVRRGRCYRCQNAIIVKTHFEISTHTHKSATIKREYGNAAIQYSLSLHRIIILSFKKKLKKTSKLQSNRLTLKRAFVLSRQSSFRFTFCLHFAYYVECIKLGDASGGGGRKRVCVSF